MKFTRAIESLKPEGAFVVLAKAKDLESQGKEIIHLEIDLDLEVIQMDWQKYQPLQVL